MKPKKESNAVLTVLLFLFAFNSASASWPPSDTIIIDGETIFIEKRFFEVDMDSLIDAGHDDVKKKTLPVHFFSLALHAGANLTSASFGTSVSAFEPLNNFVNDQHSLKWNGIAAIDLGAKFWRFPAMKGMVDLSIHTGVGYNKVKVQSNSFDTDSLIRDRNIVLRYTDGELFLEYFRILDPVWQTGELDTANIPINRDNNISYTSIDIPLKLHVDWSPSKSPWSLNVEAGVMKRLVLNNTGKNFDSFLVNSSGQYLKLNADEFKPQNIFRPVFGVGAERKFEKKSEGNASYFSGGFQFSAVLPPTSFNSGSLFYVDVKSFSLTVFCRFNL